MGIRDFLMSESLSKPFVSDQNKKAEKTISNQPNIIQNTKTLSDDNLGGSMVVNGTEIGQEFDYSSYGAEDKWQHQNRIIESYRELASDQEVSNGRK